MEYPDDSESVLNERRGPQYHDCWVVMQLHTVKLSNKSVETLVNRQLARKFEDYIPTCDRQTLQMAS